MYGIFDSETTAHGRDEMRNTRAPDVPKTREYFTGRFGETCVHSEQVVFRYRPVVHVERKNTRYVSSFVSSTCLFVRKRKMYFYAPIRRFHTTNTRVPLHTYVSLRTEKTNIRRINERFLFTRFANFQTHSPPSKLREKPERTHTGHVNIARSIVTYVTVLITCTRA